MGKPFGCPFLHRNTIVTFNRNYYIPISLEIIYNKFKSKFKSKFKKEDGL